MFFIYDSREFLIHTNRWRNKERKGNKGGMSGRRWICLFCYHIQTSRQSYSSVSTHLWQKDEKLYLILVLLSSFRLSWGVGEVLRAFVELVLHGVNWMATGTQAKVSIPVCLHILSFRFDQRSQVSKQQFSTEQCYFLAIFFFFMSCDASPLDFISNERFIMKRIWSVICYLQIGIYPIS